MIVDDGMMGLLFPVNDIVVGDVDVAIVGDVDINYCGLLLVIGGEVIGDR